ncbi:MAG TPA: hypothetical protein VNN99_14815 [Vicinamibacterales bacterium]|nr:hypothetical protein [Vicinamibacterales bacterium]
MAWDWIEKGAKRLQELGGEYKEHHALIERLLTIDPAAAQDELMRAWGAMDDRARAGVKMTLAGLTLSQQAASATAAAKVRAERLKALDAAVDQAGRAGAASTARTASSEAAFVAGAAQVTQKIAGVAERARPKAEEVYESARRGIERHAPTVEAAVKSVFNELLKTEIPGAKRNAPTQDAPPAEPAGSTAHSGTAPGASTGSAPQPVRDDRVRPAATTYAGSSTITGQWMGTLREPGSIETVGCDLHVAASGRPMWAFNDNDGFHKTELTHAGQKLQYVPPERGVVTVLVHSVSGSPGETGYVVDYSFERSSNGYLTQRYQRLALSGKLRGAQLEVTYSDQGISSFGDKAGLAAGADAREYRGSLTKQA